jgi:hypothetical protein
MKELLYARFIEEQNNTIKYVGYTAYSRVLKYVAPFTVECINKAELRVYMLYESIHPVVYMLYERLSSYIFTGEDKNI